MLRLMGSQRVGHDWTTELNEDFIKLFHKLDEMFIRIPFKFRGISKCEYSSYKIKLKWAMDLQKYSTLK